MSRTTTWTLAELLSLRTSVICPNASAVTVITYSPWQLRMSHSAVTSISSPGGTRGVDDPQFPVDVGARTQNRVVVSSARARPPGCGRWLSTTLLAQQQVGQAPGESEGQRKEHGPAVRGRAR